MKIRIKSCSECSSLYPNRNWKRRKKRRQLKKAKKMSTWRFLLLKGHLSRATRRPDLFFFACYVRRMIPVVLPGLPNRWGRSYAMLIVIMTLVSWRKVYLHGHGRGCTCHCTAALHELLSGASKEITSSQFDYLSECALQCEQCRPCGWQTVSVNRGNVFCATCGIWFATN
jgi:hypothetical protein